MKARLRPLLAPLVRLLVLLLVAVLALQLYFVARIALMAVLAPESTTFERSEIYRVTRSSGSSANTVSPSGTAHTSPVKRSSRRRSRNDASNSPREPR